MDRHSLSKLHGRWPHRQYRDRRPCWDRFPYVGGGPLLALGKRAVFLTNSHVISLDPVDEAPLRPLQAEVEFTRLNGRPRVRLGELVFSSQRIEMDISILQIIPPPDAGKLELCPTLPKISGTSMQRVYVVGHPKGQELAV